MYYGLNRTLCEVLDEMRSLLKYTQSVDTLKSLVEEAQVMGNRMEAKLKDSKDWSELHESIAEKKHELRELKKEIKAHETLLALVGERPPK